MFTNTAGPISVNTAILSFSFLNLNTQASDAGIRESSYVRVVAHRHFIKDNKKHKREVKIYFRYTLYTV